MTEAKFTKGPWKQDRFGHVVAPNGELVDFRGVSSLCAGSPERVAEAEANATLIAAAPDLLEALKETVEWISNWSPSFVEDDEWPETQEKIETAIAKAEGAA